MLIIKNERGSPTNNSYICAMKRIYRLIRFVNAIPVGFCTLIILGVISALTLMPSDDVPGISVPHIDKVVHFLMFGALSTALLTDCSRYLGRLHKRLWVAAASISSIAGGVIELMQSTMDEGRMAEWADFYADTAGAFLLPLLFWKLTLYMTDEYNLSLHSVARPEGLPDQIRQLYLESFPPDERRPWDDIVAKITDEPRFHFCLLETQCRTVMGFISWWRLASGVYVEHFAVDSTRRGHGLGAMAIERFCNEHGTQVPVVLEVELPESGEMAKRRIGFYTRCGFAAHPDVEYLQPPYTPDLQPVPLMLMTFGPAGNVEQLSREIQSTVYGVDI